MALTDWFRTVEPGSPAPAQQAFLDELGQMLDAYKPALVDRSRSSITRRAKASTIEVRLAHRNEPDAAILVGVSPDEATVVWLTGHEHIDAREAEGASRPWTTVAVDAVAGILRGDYEVEDTYRGKRRVKTRIIDAADPDGPRAIAETGSLLGWVPAREPARVERRQIGFGVEPPGTPPS